LEWVLGLDLTEGESQLALMEINKPDGLREIVHLNLGLAEVRQLSVNLQWRFGWPEPELVSGLFTRSKLFIA
jgi:hypothetical protein